MGSMTATDDLIEHLVDAERRLTVAFAKAGVDSSVLNDMRLLSNAAAELTRLQGRVAALEAENARLKDARLFPAGYELYRTSEINLLKRAEAERDEQRELLAAMMIRCSMSTGHGDTLADLVTELEPQIKALRADAERYRWLRDEAYCWGGGKAHPDEQREPVAIWTKGAVADEKIDAAIDAVRGKNNEEM